MSDTPRTDACKTVDSWNLCRELERENAALRAALDLTTDRLVFYMQNIPIAYKDYIKTNEGEISYSIVNSSLSLLKKEATL